MSGATIWRKRRKERAVKLGATTMQTNAARFVERLKCITCGSPQLESIASGYFDEDPVRSFLKADPWGESPVPYLDHEQWAFVRCIKCSTAFHMRILAPDWMERHYTSWVTQESMEQFLAAKDTPTRRFVAASGRVAHILRIEKLTRNLPSRGAVSLLDYGCGWGEFLSLCRQFGFDAHGVDFSPDRRSHGTAEIFPTLAELRPRLSRPLHAVTLFEVLEHLPDPLHVLREVNHITEVGGLLVLETPDCTGVLGIETEREYRAIDPLGHINGFTPETLRRIAREAGYEPVFPGVAQVTADLRKMLKREVKRFVMRFRPTTQQYFRKSRDSASGIRSNLAASSS